MLFPFSFFGFRSRHAVTRGYISSLPAPKKTVIAAFALKIIVSTCTSMFLVEIKNTKVQL